jgi:hypothetical protein
MLEREYPYFHLNGDKIHELFVLGEYPKGKGEETPFVSAVIYELGKIYPNITNKHGAQAIYEGLKMYEDKDKDADGV